MDIVTGIIAVAKAVPIFDKWLEKLATAYTLSRLAAMKSENVAAIRAAISMQDQRPAETAIGSHHAGEPSGLAGTEIRDELPGVTKSKILLLLICLSLTGCITRKEIEASLFLNNGLPAELCAERRELWDYGFYRRLNSGQLEFISFCDPRSKEWVGINKRDLENILNANIPDPPHDDEGE